MDWIKKMNTVLDYIEGNLDSEIDFNHIAKLSNYSFYHFQRVFTYMANTTVSEYIRRRRLTLAAFELQSENHKVIDIAIKYGYNSPTAFTRAFKAFHHITPSEAKSSNNFFTSYPPISFQITIKGVVKMNYRIETKEAFKVIGLKLETTMDDQKSLKDIPTFWSESFQSGATDEVVKLINQEPFGILGLSVGSWNKSNSFDYYIAASSSKSTPPNMEEFTVPASKWAIFECIGPMPSSIQDLQKRIFTEWLPSSGYEYGEGPDIEVYTDGDTTSNDYKCWVWLPIAKKI